jgi:hypothetical protein
MDEVDPARMKDWLARLLDRTVHSTRHRKVKKWIVEVQVAIGFGLLAFAAYMVLSDRIEADQLQKNYLTATGTITDCWRCGDAMCYRYWFIIANDTCTGKYSQAAGSAPPGVAELSCRGLKYTVHYSQSDCGSSKLVLSSPR